MLISSDSWPEPIEFTKFIVIGFYYNSTKKFRSEYPGTSSGYNAAMSINWWRCNVWGETESGRRKLIKNVYN